MIKAFHNYSIMERLSGGYTQWKKTYPTGEWAALVLPNKKLTRKTVEEAFKAYAKFQEYPDQGLAPQFFKFRKSWKTGCAIT